MKTTTGAPKGVGRKGATRKEAGRKEAGGKGAARKGAGGDAAKPEPAASGRAVSYAAPALEKGLDILELLADAAEGLSQNQIATQLGRSVGEIFRMLEVLERRAWLYRAGADGSYRLSMHMFDLAHRQSQLRHLVGAALPLMHQLAAATRQSNHLVVHHDRRILVVAQVDSPEAMGFSVRVGAHYPFRMDRVSARTYSAFQPPARTAELIQEMIDNDPAPPPQRSLERIVTAIARRGYEEKESDTFPGITDICCPIFDRSGFAVATLTLPYLRQRDVKLGVAESRHAQLHIVGLISQGLGGGVATASGEVARPAGKPAGSV